MRVEVLQENLAKAVTTVSRVISSNPQLPILGNIYLKVQKSGILLIGTNLETTISLFIPAKVYQEGEITIPAKNFAELILTLPAEKVALKLSDNWLLLEHAQGKVKFPTLMAEEFPIKEIPSVGKKQMALATLPAHELLSGLKKVVFAAAIDESRPALAGIYFQKDKQDLRLVATDGYRLSVVNLPGKATGFSQSLLVSAKALRELEKSLIGEGEVSSFLDLDGKQVFFKYNDLVLGSRLIEGEFPDFTKILPSQSQTMVIFVREEMIQALRSAAIFARENANIVRLEVDKKGVHLIAGATQVGEGSFTLKETRVEGEAMAIAFNFRFLMEALAVFDQEQVAVSFSGNLAPAKLFAEKEVGFFHIIMPVRLQS